MCQAMLRKVTLSEFCWMSINASTKPLVCSPPLQRSISGLAHFRTMQGRVARPGLTVEFWRFHFMVPRQEE